MPDGFTLIPKTTIFLVSILCEKLGMRREGMFQDFVSFVNNPDGTPHYENTCQYAILKQEWVHQKSTADVSFSAVIEPVPDKCGAFVRVPFDIKRNTEQVC